MILSKKGFSLLEVTIVLAIIGAIFGLVSRGAFDKKADTRKVLRDFMIAGKDIRGRAKLNGSTYRLAFQIDPKESAWWVEKANQSTLIDKKKFDEEREKQAKEGHHDPEAKAPEFQPDLTIFKKKQSLPSGYSFKQVESATLDTLVTDGIGYIHFFPQGLIETAAFQIEDSKKTVWTIIFNPITGQTDMIPEAKSLKDLAR